MALFIPRALTIAGSDSGGGAGIQADLKTFVCLGVHGMSALTCTTAQNTVGVKSVIALPLEHIVDQIEMVASDIGIDAAKTGMLLNQEIILTVIEQIKLWKITTLVVDPVMVSRTGVKLLAEDAIAAYAQLIPLALIVTPNLYEAEILSKHAITSLHDMEIAAQRILTFGANAVLIKGGALKEQRGTDLYYDGQRMEFLYNRTVPTHHTHGTGCTLSAAITAFLSLGYELFPAVTAAKAFVDKALSYALPIGKGQGPVGHAYSRIAPPARESL